MSNKKLTKVTLVKLASRATFGSVKGTKVIPNKKKKKPRFPQEED